MDNFIFYPRQRIQDIVQNNVEKTEVSIVKKEEKSIDKKKKQQSFISKQKKHGNSK